MSEAQQTFERLFGERPVEPNRCDESPEEWCEIAVWEGRRADFFKVLIEHPTDYDYAYRMVQ